jgi:hypothetical protein
MSKVQKTFLVTLEADKMYRDDINVSWLWDTINRDFNSYDTVQVVNVARYVDPANTVTVVGKIKAIQKLRQLFQGQTMSLVDAKCMVDAAAALAKGFTHKRVRITYNPTGDEFTFVDERDE